MFTAKNFAPFLLNAFRTATGLTNNLKQNNCALWSNGFDVDIHVERATWMWSKDQLS